MHVPSWILLKFRIAVVALALLVGLGLQDAHGQITWLEMGVDANQDGTSGGGAIVPLGFSQQVDVRVDDLVAPSGYMGYQVRVRYDDSKLDLTLPHDEYANNRWPGAGGSLWCEDTEPVEDDSGTKDWRGGCLDFLPPDPSHYTGVLHSLQFTCEAPGRAVIQLVNDTVLIDPDGWQQWPHIVVNDTITCYQQPLFSLSRLSHQVIAGPYNPADVLGLAAGWVPPPLVLWPCGAGGFNLAFCKPLPPPLLDEVDAISQGRDFTLPPPNPDLPNDDIYFSVAHGALGVAGSGVYKETVGCGPGGPEPEADEFSSSGAGTNTQYFDGNGVQGCTNPPAPSLDLIEPGDDLDALDFRDYLPHPMFVSLDAASLSLPVLPGGPYSGADILKDNMSGSGIVGAYARFGALGLVPSDDIDALCINDNGDGVYGPTDDQVWFSLAPGSPSLTIAAPDDSPADIFAAPFAAGAPVVAAGQLGLLDSDNLDALKCYASACIDRLGDTACDDPVNDPDDDGCVDAEEQAGAAAGKPGSTGAYDPTAWYDFYDVPVAVRRDAQGANGVKNRAVNVQDVVAVLKYVGTFDGGPENSNGVDYDSIKGVDLNGDTTNDIVPPLHPIEEGQKYDRSPSPLPNPPYDAGPPSGAVNVQDVVAVLKQVGLSCAGPP
jgi:hypothetical protein